MTGTVFNQNDKTAPKVSKTQFRCFGGNNVGPTSSKYHDSKSVGLGLELNLYEEGLEIPWSELVLKEQIGTGIGCF